MHEWQMRPINTDVRHKQASPFFKTTSLTGTRELDQGFIGASPLRDGVLSQTASQANKTAPRPLIMPTVLSPLKVPSQPSVSTPKQAIPAPLSASARQFTGSGSSGPASARIDSQWGQSRQALISAGAHLVGKGTSSSAGHTTTSISNSTAKKTHWADAYIVNDQDDY